MLTSDEQSLSHARPNAVDHAGLDQLHYLGNYKRRLATNMARMMENAHDWEHLPYVHASSFASIDLIAQGDWGWRAKIGLHGGGHQLLDLLVDAPKNYWVSTVYSGPGEGTQIHTQATTLNTDEIEVDVRFYLPEAPADEEIGTAVHAYLADQYRQLYDEDIGLMSGRQSALEDRVRWRKGQSDGAAVLVGLEAELARDGVHLVETETGRFVVRYWNDAWIAHSAVCPHLLGPLGESGVDADGAITCPWHGYRFDVATGENIGEQCKALATAPRVEVREGGVCLRFVS
ncbi:MAG: Rieske 2Fe-2S domain-containing protein [Pseudomonadota bacterium]